MKANVEKQPTYRLIDADASDPHGWTLKERLKMLIYTLAGLLLAALHHILYSRLSGRSAEGTALSVQGRGVLSQTIVKGVGNAISILVGICFASAIGIAFAQHFWRVLRAESHKVKQVDAAFSASRGSPLATLSTMPVAPILGLMAIAALAKPLITIFAPASLTVVATQYSVPEDCRVTTANVQKANLASYYISDHSGTAFLHNPTIRTSTLVTRIILGGSYLLPPSPCGTCSYNVSFTGAGVNCTNVTGTLPPLGLQVPNGPNTWLGIWNATYSWADNTVWTFQVDVRNGSFNDYGPVSTYECKAYRADYTVQVMHANVSTAEVLSVSFQDPINGTEFYIPKVQDPVMAQLNGIIGAVGDQLEGSITYRDGYCVFDTSTSMMASSPVLDVGSNCVNNTNPTFTWPDVQWTIPSLVQNVSISLLSGLYPSAENDTYLDEVDTICFTSPLTYHYARPQLLATYAIALLAVVICFVLGLRAVAANMHEENLELIRFVKALSGKDVASASDNVVGEMVAEVHDPEGEIIISPDPEVPARP